MPGEYGNHDGYFFESALHGQNEFAILQPEAFLGFGWHANTATLVTQLIQAEPTRWIKFHALLHRSKVERMYEYMGKPAIRNC